MGLDRKEYWCLDGWLGLIDVGRLGLSWELVLASCWLGWLMFGRRSGKSDANGYDVTRILFCYIRLFYEEHSLGFRSAHRLKRHHYTSILSAQISFVYIRDIYNRTPDIRNLSSSVYGEQFAKEKKRKKLG